MPTNQYSSKELNSVMIGATHEISFIVTEKDSAAAVGSGLLDVFSTPSMIAGMEKAAAVLLQTYLEDPQSSVGIMLNVEHLAPTPIGSSVYITAKVTNVDEKIISYEVSARDDTELIGRGVHKRAIISVDQFLDRVNSKKGS
ncbi:MAG: thioesterase family protein [Anaerolineales bacterium]|nr:thioesterase family protein [Anaerolineales bacterium]